MEWIDVTRGVAYRKLLAQGARYLEESELMSMDANAVASVNLQYYIVNDGTNIDANHLNAVVIAYQNYIQSDEVMQQIKENLNLDMDAAYLEELISVSNTIQANASLIEVENIGTADVRNTMAAFEIQVRNANQAVSNSIADEVENVIADYSPQIPGITSGAAVLFERTESVGVDQSLMTLQKDYLQGLQTAAAAWTTLSASMTDAQKEAVNQICNMEEIEAEEAEETTVSLSMSSYFSKKNLVIGAVLGIVLACICIVIRYLFDNSIKNELDITESAGVNFLAEWRHWTVRNSLD